MNLVHLQRIPCAKSWPGTTQVVEGNIPVELVTFFIRNVELVKLAMTTERTK